MSKGKNKAKTQKQQPIRYSKKEQPKNTVVSSFASKVTEQEPIKENVGKCKDIVVSPCPKQPEVSLDFTQPITLQFSAVDTLFFRETRPMESQGELQSVFPPSVRTLAGAVRSWIGECWVSKEGEPVDWKNFSEQEDHPLREIIGFGNNLGALKFQGAWLSLNGERLYPAPLNLMKTKKDELFFLKLDQPIKCDLGKQVRLATFPSNDECYKGGKALENTWLTAEGLQAVLMGSELEEKFSESYLKEAQKLFERESRLGIARDNQKRGVIEGLLYQTEHVRPNTELFIELDVVTGLPERLPQTVVRLGGEGRPAQIQLKQKTNSLPSIDPALIKANKFALYLLTPLAIKPDELLPDFTKEAFKNGFDYELKIPIDKPEKKFKLKLHGAVTGKVLREGGWDMAKHEPRAVTNFISAGSVFYFELLDGSSAEQVISALHNQQIGTLTEYGFGHVAVGVWNDEAKD